MTAEEKKEILKKFKQWFTTSLIESHKRNTEKLRNINEFQINPFLLYYLASYLEGNADPKSLAKVLVYPRVLGTSITTSFGTGMQKFVSEILGAYGSTTSGIDIEFIDQVDGRKKYCQLKSGPNAINKDDITTISNHFKAVRNLARTNNVQLQYGDLVFALTYGEQNELNSFVNALAALDITVYAGQEFWHRFTGDEEFYKHLIFQCSEVAREIDMKEVVEDVIDDLSETVEERFRELFN